MTAVVIDLNSRRPATRASRTAQVAGICASLVLHGTRMCGAPLAYELGRWRHATARPGCPEVQPALCEHGCGEAADIDQHCAEGHPCCDGCCWERDDQLEGRRMWPR